MVLLCTLLESVDAKFLRLFMLMIVVHWTQHNLKGKIVVCFGSEDTEFTNGFLVQEAGGVGVIGVPTEPRGPWRRSSGCSFYIASSSFGVQGDCKLY